MMSVLTGGVPVQNRLKTSLRVEADNVEELLLVWLREILWIYERKRIIFMDFQIEKNSFSDPDDSPVFVEADLYGEHYSQIRHGICREIKAVTRHGLQIRKLDAGWETRILFDV
jgi:SHS2 domain-containing protein